MRTWRQSCCELLCIVSCILVVVIGSSQESFSGTLNQRVNQDYEALSSKNLSENLVFTSEIGISPVYSTLYVPRMNNIWLKKTRITPLLFLNASLRYRRFGLRLEQFTAVPIIALELLIYKNLESQKIYLELETIPAALFYKNLWNVPVGRGLGIKIERNKWSYGIAYTTFLTGADRFKKHNGNIIDTSWIRVSFGRRLFKPKAEKER